MFAFVESAGRNSKEKKNDDAKIDRPTLRGSMEFRCGKLDWLSACREMARMIEAISAGFQTTVQDCGRFGLRRFGVTPGGALDSVSLRLANLLVGNRECMAGLEIASGRVRLHEH